ncbi:MAG TPA: hypothetical protein PK816_12985 [Candidatus Cloacimonadota bacterium]|nr:hypothetical protein [Candidatus Cloacimonadota bacterium]
MKKNTVKLKRGQSYEILKVENGFCALKNTITGNLKYDFPVSQIILARSKKSGITRVNEFLRGLK